MFKIMINDQSSFPNHLTYYLFTYLIIQVDTNIMRKAFKRYSITEEDVEIRFSEILKANVVQDPYLIEITIAVPFR